MKENLCRICNKVGHMESLCWHFDDPQKPNKANPTDAPMPPRITPDPNLCTWLCKGNGQQKGCGHYVNDEAGTAIKCPGCKAPKPPLEEEETKEPKKPSFAEMLKKGTKGFSARLQNTDPEGNLPLPPEEQEATAKIDLLEIEIGKLEGIASCAPQLAAKKKEVEALRNNLPKSHLHFRDWRL